MKYILLLSIFSVFSTCNEKDNTLKGIPLEASGNINAKVTDVFSFTKEEHPSVGFNVIYKISNKEIIDFKKKSTDPLSKLHKSNAPGSDKTLSTYFFEAKKEGKAQLIIKYEFRGAIEEEYIYDFTVE